MTATDLVGGVIDRMLSRWHPKCLDRGLCLLRPGHVGFHKTHGEIWPNSDDDPEYWRDVADYLLNVGPIPELSLVELRHALGAPSRSEPE